MTWSGMWEPEQLTEISLSSFSERDLSQLILFPFFSCWLLLCFCGGGFCAYAWSTLSKSTHALLSSSLGIHTPNEIASFKISGRGRHTHGQ